MPVRKEDGDVEFTATVAVDGASTLTGAVTASGDVTVSGDIKKITSSGNDVKVGGVLYKDSATHGNVGATSDLATYTVPSTTLSADNMSIEFEAWGTFAANTHVKTVYISWSTNDVLVLGYSVATIAAWKIKGKVVRVDATHVDLFVEGTINNVTTPAVFVSLALVGISGVIKILSAIGAGAANNDTLQEYFEVRWSNANT